MPQIPEVPRTTSTVDIGSKDHALAVARVLAGTSKREDTARFLAVIRRFLRENKEAKKALLVWYQEVPAADGDEDRPSRLAKKKRLKKRRDEESSDE